MEFNWLVLLFLLLPVAFVTGWRLANRRNIHSKDHEKGVMNPDYLRGLNYVLDEQPDKAIEIFIRLIEADSETVETHLALGNLFRRRGEVDRAIRIHQNLIARPTLSDLNRAQALLELGMDYLKLGILDRAEGLFLELISMDMLSVQAYTYLLDIYQQEKDWEKAITAAKRLESFTSDKYGNIIAQFFCEQAEIELAVENIKMAKSHLARALNLDPGCVRASLIEGCCLMNSGDFRTAINSFKRVVKQDPDYIDEMIYYLRDCYEKVGKEDKFKDYLQELTGKHNKNKTLILLTDIIAKDNGDSSAITFISDKLLQKPTVQGVDHFLNYVIKESEGELRKHLSSIKELTEKLLQVRVVYLCNICGFKAKNIHWHCPGCKNWNTVKPVQDI